VIFRVGNSSDLKDPKALLKQHPKVSQKLDLFKNLGEKWKNQPVLLFWGEAYTYPP